MNAFESIGQKIISLDNQLTQTISRLVADYSIAPESPLLATKIPVLIKFNLYLAFLILPISILKVVYPGNRIVTLLVIVLLILLALTLATIFFGFFQLLYNF